ncbi:MAG: portal protein, partial [Pseudomonadota bacterium]
MPEERHQKILRRLQALESQRSQWEALWREVSEYILPSRGFFSGQTPNQGETRQDRILDGTATRAVRVLAAGLQGGLTSPARPWFRLGLADRELMSFSPVREYLDECERRLYGAFSRSNFYSAIHAVYTELSGFGTAVLYEEQDPAKGVSFKVITAGEYCLAEGHQGLVDTVYRKFWMTARQMVQRFGDRVSTRVKDAAAANPDEFFLVVHAVQPRSDRRPGKADKADMEWESVYLEFDRSDGLLQAGGYEEFPFMAPRWGASGADVYGRS